MQVTTEQVADISVSVPSEAVAMEAGTEAGTNGSGAKRKANDDPTPAGSNNKKPKIGKELVYQSVRSLLMYTSTEARPPPLKR